jgi:hypothetical protein
MNIIKSLINVIASIKDAKNAGIINDASLGAFFRAEYKGDADRAYEYWLATNGGIYQK